MRVITGLARGRKLEAPAGDAIRPTTDMVKEAIFNIIQFDIPGRRVLDLFAGTGQLGIEALSRGAATCDFVDSSKAACALVRANLAATELSGGQVYQSDATSFLRRGQQYDLVFVDPPYDMKHIDEVVADLMRFDILNQHGIMVCETKTEETLPEATAPYVKGRSYRYGKVHITVYTKEPT